MLVFPSAFFLAQIYTEGLFIGLAFSSLMFTKRKQWIWASLLGMLAAWTRAHGAAMSLPLLLAWVMSINWKSEIRSQLTWKWALQGIFALLPLGAYYIWRTSPLGEGWAELQEFYFGRGLMTIESSIESWKNAYFYARYMSQEGLIYFSIEVAATLIALVSSIWLLRRDPIVALFSLAVVLLSALSGSAQSMARYMLIAPAMFIALGYWGKNKLFDKAWTIASILLLGMSVLLFSYDMWVG
jgi:Gpi18-like mannosyltransferase